MTSCYCIGIELFTATSGVANIVNYAIDVAIGTPPPLVILLSNIEVIGFVVGCPASVGDAQRLATLVAVVCTLARVVGTRTVAYLCQWLTGVVHPSKTALPHTITAFRTLNWCMGLLLPV